MLHKRFFGLAMLLLLALTLTGAVAQDNTTNMGNAAVIGDANSQALQVVQNYLQSRDPNLLAEDAQFFDRTYPEPFAGRDTVAQMQEDFFNGAFTNTTIDPMRFVVADNTVVAEYQFQGTNTGPFRGNPETNLNVSFPVVSIFEVENGQITSVNRYYDAASLNNQLGYIGYPGTGVGAVPPGPVITDETISNVSDYPEQFYNQDVTIDGLVGEGVGNRGFILYERDLLGTDDVLVIDRSENRTDFIQLPNTPVQVSGTVQPFVLADLEAELGFDLDDTLYNDLTTRYGDNLPVLLADSITNLEHVSYIQNILDNPEAFYGKQVGFGGRVGEAVSNQAGFIYEDALVDVDRILVIGSSGDVFDFTTTADQLVEVQGTVREFVLVDIENEFGFDLDDNAFGDYQGPAVIADSITPITQ